ncbi:hypothetical protein PMAYCL1PPCAC_11410, partial [Pristionchus mayeri]
RFAPLYQVVSQLRTDPEDHEEHRNLIKDIIRGSMIVEWPRSVVGLYNNEDDEALEVDQAPLIHRARTTVKCRTDHPTMRVKMYAFTAAAEQQRGNGGPELVEAFFRCSLTKAQSGVVGENCDARKPPIAGRMIMNQRHHSAGPNAAQFTGLVVLCKKASRFSQCMNVVFRSELCARAGEMIRSSSFKYEKGVLCATFPEMGVTLNSKERRQLDTRYALLNEVYIKIGEGLMFQAFQSLPFLISTRPDQTESMLNSIIWSRMVDKEHYDGSEQQINVPYGLLKEVARNFVKHLNTQARPLTIRELLHFQAMTFLPK